ncbi:MAG: VWA domain-containing protein, partial [Sphingobacteriaceae bacterium]|nr:VWA domain-containing protein [Sphingobacteriaceae bacterium]
MLTDKIFKSINQFLKYGYIKTEEYRKKLIDYTLSLIKNKGEGEVTNLKERDEYYIVCDKIINEKKNDIRSITENNETLQDDLLKEVISFLESTNKKIINNKVKYEQEKKQIQSLMNYNEVQFRRKWKDIKSITSQYNDINHNFYEKEIEKSKNEKDRKKSIRDIKNAFVKAWNESFTKKIIKEELELIESERKKFIKDFYERIDKIKQLQGRLKPIFKELGRLWDLSSGDWTDSGIDVLIEYARMLENNHSLENFVDSLGRMRKAEIEYEEEIRKKIVYVSYYKPDPAFKEEVVGVTEGKDLNRLLPSELALLDEDLETIFFKKYIEGRLQNFEYSSKFLDYKAETIEERIKKQKENKKGPFILCVDTSASMNGTPEVIAKTLSFAFLKRAVEEDRKCYLISFSTKIETLELTSFKTSFKNVISFLQMSFQGGTDSTPALEHSLKMLKEENYKKADVVMISDFVMDKIPNDTEQKIIDAQKDKTRFHSLLIGSSQNEETIKIFNTNWVYDANDPK